MKGNPLWRLQGTFSNLKRFKVKRVTDAQFSCNHITSHVCYQSENVAHTIHSEHVYMRFVF